MAAKIIMVQGTMSNSGKSFVVGGLCRIFRQDGFKTAPFKSQNMALNSYVTDDGYEMGRAQVMQAEAAKTNPNVNMNPILLKPTSTMGSQVIVMGEIWKNMKAKDYYANKSKLIPYVKEAFNKLANEYDVIVIEGAGSPAEINLRQNDIVNMGLAEMVDSPVILVGDIDRGGVFASLYGTIELLEKNEQDRIKGVVINKFRGDVDILKPGIDMLEAKINKKVLGVIPMENIDIDDEDSLASRIMSDGTRYGIDIAVIKLPHMANFTDFNIFERVKGVSLRYISSSERFGEPDVIIIPGTKNTIEDMKFLNESKLAQKIIEHDKKGKNIIGICGGYQILGKEIKDNEHVECGETIKGLGLLDIMTEFQQKKFRGKISGVLKSDKGILKYVKGMKVSGYEIHNGISTNIGDIEEIIELEDKRVEGMINENGNVFGTYLHGIFDSAGFINGILKDIAVKRGISLAEDMITTNEYKEEQYDKLANLIRKSLDMNEIYKILGITKA